MKKSLIPVSCLIAAVMASGFLPARVNAAGVPESAALTVSKIMTVETTPAGGEEETREAEVRTSNGRLRVRKGAGTQYEILTYLHDGDKVRVLSVEGDWAKVATDAGDGYVSTSFLKMEETSSRESKRRKKSPLPKIIQRKHLRNRTLKEPGPLQSGPPTAGCGSVKARVPITRS